MIPRITCGGDVAWFTCDSKTIVDQLYDEENYNGEKIEKMKNSVLIKNLIGLRKNALNKKSELECYFMDNKKEVTKYKKLFKSKKDFLSDLIKTDTIEWLEDLPVYNALITEIEKRKLTDYLNIILEREDN